ncbi:CGNR zinc finger domain-containing protein [Yinghuangia sp. YIM S09857]|uniref:CGNR zinc finger domain-containing protein n=1 Tax=Yinghuangia sp. YIM S09857 TaxID=3436929 RepID=UPI003F52FB1D
MSAHEPAPDAAPGALRRVEELINTFSVETGAESLTDPAALAAWLTERHLLPETTGVGPEDLTRARTLREGLRAMLTSNNPAPDAAAAPTAPAALTDLAVLARELPLVLDPSASPPTLVPHTPGTPDAALAQLLADVAASVADGTWSRMKACRMCEWAYYDHSRNRSRAWCSMALCGNRAKAQAFRNRTR